MSIRTMNRVWSTSKLKGNDLLAELALADIADDDGYAWPSIPHWAEKSRISPRTMQRIIRKIEATGEVLVQKGAGMIGTAGGPQRTHLYRVVVGLKGDDRMTPPLRLRGGVKQPRGGVRSAQGGDTVMSREPSVDPSTETSSRGDPHFSPNGNGKGSLQDGPGYRDALDMLKGDPKVSRSIREKARNRRKALAGTDEAEVRRREIEAMMS